MKKKKFNFRARLHSFIFAGRGILVLFREEHNARIHLFIAVSVIFMGIVFDILATEWMFCILAIGLVLSAEAVNSSLESIADSITLEENAHIKKAKDFAAAAVLILSISAALVGLTIFSRPLYLLVFSK